MGFWSFVLCRLRTVEVLAEGARSRAPGSCLGGAGGFTGASYALCITAVKVTPVQSTPNTIQAVKDGRKKVTCDNSNCYKLGQVKGGIAVPEVALK